MSDFLEKMIGPNKEPEPAGQRTTCTSQVILAGDMPDLAEALNVVMFHAMNRPSGGGVRQVGEKCSILMPGVEVMMLDTKTGQTESAMIGDYVISIERVK